MDSTVFFMREDRMNRGVASQDSLVLKVYRNLDVLAYWKPENTRASIRLARQLEDIQTAQDVGLTISIW